jgi:serine/threonine protein kinase/uncharacterized RDD family membrane protein YckC
MQQQLAHYQIQDLLGEGTFASVYRALDQKFDRYVALKVLKPVWLSDVQAVERFKREAKTMAQLRHPHIVDVYDVGQTEGYIYLAQLLVEGETLLARLERSPLPWDEMLSVLQGMAGALDYAHGRDVIHRDVKPSNILLGPQGRAYLGDFGLVRAAEGSMVLSTTSGGMIGTPAYMAPEQWEGKKISPATDVYALSCVVVEMLTGQVLFDGNTPAVVMRQHLMEGPKLPAEWLEDAPEDVPEGVTEVLQRGLAEDPADRISSAGELVVALARLSAPQPEVLAVDDEMPTKPRLIREPIALWLVGSAGQTYALKPGSLVMGRGSQCDICLDDPQASREHAVLKFDGQRCIVYDQDTINGTFINKRWVGPEGHSFNPGDQLTIGETTFTLTSVAPAEAASEEDAPVEEEPPAAQEMAPPPLPPSVSPRIATKPHLLEKDAGVQSVEQKPDVSSGQTIEVIGFGRRLLAFIIDMIVLQISAVILSNLGESVLDRFTLSSFACLEILLYLVYFVGFWTIAGRTPGKMVLGIKVVGLDGSPVSFGTAILRYIGYVFGFALLWLGFFWVAFDGRRQGWHDKLAGTYVVRRNTRFSSRHVSVVPSDAGSAWIWIVLIVLFAIFVGGLLLVSLMTTGDISDPVQIREIMR